MRTLKSLLFILGISGVSLQTSTLFAHSHSTDRIIGDNDLVHVPASSAKLPYIQAIGRMKLGCTVTHVGNGIAITAGHCFASGKFQNIRTKLPCNDTKYEIRWGVTYDTEGYLTSQCTEVIATEYNRERDYAIFRVSAIPPTVMELSPETIEPDQQISIYSHPRRRPMEWSQWCTVEGFVDQSNGHQFFYSCDTEGGSSGAAVLDSANRVVGIHNYYDSVLDRNGATMIHSTPLAQILRNPHGSEIFSPFEEDTDPRLTVSENLLRQGAESLSSYTLNMILITSSLSLKMIETY
jgi:V8-like Glu-specific endopeptidase